VNVFLVEDSPLLRPRLEALLASIAGARLVGQAAENVTRPLTPTGEVEPALLRYRLALVEYY